MALELIFDNESNFIDHNEEELLTIAYGDTKYPHLTRLWDDFYDNPIIYYNFLNDIVHELITIRKQLLAYEGKDDLVSAIDRLLPFFSSAYKQVKTIKCISD